jgi:Carboxypeptidase regulatory-like domain
VSVVADSNVVGVGGGRGNGAGIGGGRGSGLGVGQGGGTGGGEYRADPGQVVGRVFDATGTELTGATVTASSKGQLVDRAITNAAGWFILPNVGPGRLTLTATLEGFKTAQAAVSADTTRPRRVDFRLEPGELHETVTVAADAVESEEFARKSLRDASAQASPSQNVFNLQRRVVGVLPVRVDVPRAGTAYRFVRPLVLDETTSVSFDYRTR